jgi:hypothetical protein
MRRFDSKKWYKTLLSVILLLTLVACQPSGGSAEEDGNEIGNVDVSGSVSGIAEEAKENKVGTFEETDSVSDLSAGQDFSEPVSPALNPPEQREAPLWEYINDKTVYLGKSAFEIVSEIEYSVDYKKVDGSERLILHDGSNIYSFVFSNDVWEDGSHCIGVYIVPSVHDLVMLPENTHQMKNMFREPSSWHGDESEGMAYYRYVFDNIEIRFYADESGELLADGNMLVKTVDSEMGSEPPVDLYARAFIDIEQREKIEWKPANNYIAYMGKTWNEVKSDYPNMEYSFEYMSGIDPKTGIHFDFPDIESICEKIYIPVRTFFPDTMQRPITRETLVNQWTGNYAWYREYGGDGQGCFYVYNFSDFRIYIASEPDGTVPEDFFVNIELQGGPGRY